MKAVNHNIIITGIKIDGHSISIPSGLSELLNKAKAWSTEKPDFIGYHREVFKKNGKLITVLTKN